MSVMIDLPKITLAMKKGKKGDIVMHEKRRDKRHELHVHLVLKPITATMDTDTLQLDVEVTDASHGGIGFLSKELLEVGTYYDAKLQIWSKAVVQTILIKFFIRQTATPETGPILNAAISAGSSEKSNLINEGIKGTLKLSIIKTVETAPNIPVTVIKRILCLMFVFCVDIKKSPFIIRGDEIKDTQDTRILFSFLIRTLTVGQGISPCQLALADFTAGTEFHRSPKILYCMIKNSRRTPTREVRRGFYL